MLCAVCCVLCALWCRTALTVSRFLARLFCLSPSHMRRRDTRPPHAPRRTQRFGTRFDGCLTIRRYAGGVSWFACHNVLWCDAT